MSKSKKAKGWSYRNILIQVGNPSGLFLNKPNWAYYWADNQAPLVPVSEAFDSVQAAGDWLEMQPAEEARHLSLYQVQRVPTGWVKTRVKDNGRVSKKMRRFVWRTP